jgi:surface antigen
MLIPTPPPDPPIYSQIVKQEPAQPEKVDVEYIVKPGDNLTVIAKAYSVDLSRLWAKNTQLDNPDLIEPDKPLKIPDKDEVLTDRPMPTTIGGSTFSIAPANSPPSGGFSYGNDMYYGWCTWWVKEHRPDLPRGLGDAYQWVANAQRMGLATGTEPRVNAAAQLGNHVALVISVNADGSFRISEMNGTAGFGKVDERDISANSGWWFIY